MATRFSHIISVVDSHTEGQPTRIALSGFPPIKGSTMAEKFVYIKQSEVHNQIREALMLEPRGHVSMFGAILTDACNPKADWGVIFMSHSSFMPACGHGTIGISMALVDMGYTLANEPESVIVFDTPNGLVTAHVTTKDSKAIESWFENVPAFLYQDDVSVDVPGLGNINVDIAFGGNFFVIVPVEHLDLTINLSNMPELRDKGLRIRKTISDQVKIQHPIEKYLNYVEVLLYIGPPSHPEALPPNSVRQMTVVGEAGMVGRGPCGAGTSANIARLYGKGKLKIGEKIVHESLLGRCFYGRALREAEVGNLKGVVTSVRGTAHITGIHQFVIDSTDDLGYGFLF